MSALEKMTKEEKQKEIDRRIQARNRARIRILKNEPSKSKNKSTNENKFKNKKENSLNINWESDPIWQHKVPMCYKESFDSRMSIKDLSDADLDELVFVSEEDTAVFEQLLEEKLKRMIIDKVENRFLDLKSRGGLEWKGSNYLLLDYSVRITQRVHENIHLESADNVSKAVLNSQLHQNYIGLSYRYYYLIGKKVNENDIENQTQDVRAVKTRGNVHIYLRSDKVKEAFPF